MFWPLAVIALLSLVYLFLIKPMQYWKRVHVRQYNVVQTYRDILASIIATESTTDATKRIYDDFPDQRYVGSYQLVNPTLFLRDLNLIKQITIKDFDYFSDHMMTLSEENDPLFSRNLLTLKGEKWRSMRNILSPSFTSSKLKTIYPLVVNCAKQFITFFEKDNHTTIEAEMKDVFKRVACDVIATSAFGISCNSLENPKNEFFSKGTVLLNTSISTLMKLILTVYSPKISEFLNIAIINKKLSKFFENIISENINARETKGIYRPDMIQLLVEAKQKIGTAEEDADQDENKIYDDNKDRKIQLSDEDIFSQAFLFFFAGFETVSTSMSFLAYNLALNPGVQEKLYKEIKENMSSFGVDPTYENLMKMKYLDMVISENLRVAPVTPNTDRACVKPYTIQPINSDEHPVHLRVGDNVIIPIYGLHNDPKYFPNPKQFDPERFNDKNKTKIVPGSYIPFGNGPRLCIGNRFALMEMKLIFYYILSKFRIVVIDKTPIPMKVSTKNPLAVNIEGGFWVGLQKRNV